MKRFLQCFVIFAVSCLNLRAAGLPDLTIPNGIGVNIHFVRGHERDLDLIAAAGIKFIRMDFSWGGIERKKGEYDWAAYEELTANLEKRGLRAIYILDYSNSLYEETVVSKNPLTGQEHRDTASPQHPDSVSAYAKWTAATVKHFSGRNIIWEIWNEPNISFWKPKPDVQQYNRMFLAAVKAMREADPKCVIIGPATSEVPIPFLEAFFSAGALDYLDAVSIHPYRNYKKDPETAAEDYEKLRALIEKHAPSNKKNIPIISGEWGYSTFTKGITVEKQAAFVARQQLANLLHGIPISVWYDWKNDGENPDEREENFGIVTYNLQPKPAYVAIQTLTRELSGFQVDKRLTTSNPADFILLLKNKSVRKLAAWTTADAHTTTVTVNDKSIELNLTEAPAYRALDP